MEKTSSHINDIEAYIPNTDLLAILGDVRTDKWVIITESQD